jgi:diketogulonate reductase-like aldo/keto reductase
MIPTVQLPSGERVPRFGLGTWRMGERASSRAAELAALRLGIELGVTLIDTAEMYGEGGAEAIVGAAIAGVRDRMFVVSKVYPHNASRRGAIAACERSLKRLATDRIDLYLLHWRGEHPLADTVAAFEQLRADGKIRYWGVSNFDVSDMRELAAIDAGRECATNQVLFNLAQRAPEWALLAWQRERRITTMAYSPVDQGKLLRHRTLRALAERRGATPAQIALAWLLRFEDVMTIPKATDPAHLRDDLGALAITLDAADLQALDAAFPPPDRAASIGLY